jgi:translation initiation factor 2B subunit (eIF-2B alpha/beta/delta family)
VAAAATRAARLLGRGASCLTLSSSEAVYQTLLAARRLRRLARVVVAESRPGREGLVLARRLGARAIPVVVIVDAAVAAEVQSVDAVVVGADAVTRSGVWNKAGTLGAALAARAAGRAVLVVTTEDRLVPAALARRLRVPEAEPAAVLRRPPRGVSAVSRLFDVTPLGLVGRVVTEAGAFTPAVLRRRLPPSRGTPRSASRGAGTPRARARSSRGTSSPP